MKDRIKNAAIKTKEWTKDHSFEILMYGATAASLVVSYAIAAKAVDAENARQEAIADLYKKAMNEGRTVLPGPDGMFWLLPKDQK